MGNPMTLRTLCTVLCLVLARIGSANADPITVYYDPAAWLAAINAFGPVTIGPYSDSVTITDVISTAETDSRGFPRIVGETYSTSPGDFIGLNWSFTQLGDISDSACFGEPNCTFSAPTERILHFNPGIAGFYSLDATIPWYTAGFLNGELIDGFVHAIYNGFFGVVGSTAVLDFSSDCDLCDSFGVIVLSNIQVAIPVVSIAEPSALACLFSAFLILMVSAARLQRGG